jgi:ABC-type antimicrobial peptide transport system permease subunit
MATLVFGIASRDPLTFALVPLVLAIVAVVTAIVPACRAATVDPMDALRKGCSITVRAGRDVRATGRRL